MFRRKYYSIFLGKLSPTNSQWLSNLYQPSTIIINQAKYSLEPSRHYCRQTKTYQWRLKYTKLHAKSSLNKRQSENYVKNTLMLILIFSYLYLSSRGDHRENPGSLKLNYSFFILYQFYIKKPILDPNSVYYHRSKEWLRPNISAER